MVGFLSSSCIHQTRRRMPLCSHGEECGVPFLGQGMGLPNDQPPCGEPFFWRERLNPTLTGLHDARTLVLGSSRQCYSRFCAKSTGLTPYSCLTLSRSASD